MNTRREIVLARINAQASVQDTDSATSSILRLLNKEGGIG